MKQNLSYLGIQDNKLMGLKKSNKLFKFFKMQIIPEKYANTDNLHRKLSIVIKIRESADEKN